MCIKCHTSRPLNRLLDRMCCWFFIEVLPNSVFCICISFLSFLSIVILDSCITSFLLLFFFLDLVVELATWQLDSNSPRKLQKIWVSEGGDGSFSTLIRLSSWFGHTCTVTRNILGYSLFLSYFEKIAHMSVRAHVSLYVGMFVARANKVEGTMSWCLGTNEILASI